MTRRWLAGIGVVVSAALLAFPLRGVVHEVIVVPLSYVLWLLGLLYVVVPQQFWWIAVTLLVLFLLGKSLLIEIKAPRLSSPVSRVDRGKVEGLAAAMQKSDRGIYFKWLVANRLGKLAHQILQQREMEKSVPSLPRLSGKAGNRRKNFSNISKRDCTVRFQTFRTAGIDTLVDLQKLCLITTFEK